MRINVTENVNVNEVANESGFSLVELLVVVAIIGILAAVGVVGYQGYVESTKRRVTESNAKAVHQWLLNTQAVRAADIETDPAVCGRESTHNFGDCFGTTSGLASSTGPFASFKNPYKSSLVGSMAILGSVITSLTAVDNTTLLPLDAAAMTGNQQSDATCTQEEGSILVAYDSATANTGDITVLYCTDHDNDDDAEYIKFGETVVWE